LRRLAALLTFVVTVLVAATACAGGGGKGEALVIGSIYPTSGPQRAGGTDEERGVRLAVEWANTHGGVHGRTVRLESADAPRPETVPSAMRFLRDRGARVVLGSHGSATSAAAATVAGETGMMLWETGAVGGSTLPANGGRSFFRLAPMGANLGRNAIAFIRDELAPKLQPVAPLRYAVVFVDDPYGRSVGNGALAEVQGSGQVLAASLPYDANRADFAALARRIAEARTDVLFAVSYLDDGVALVRALTEAKVPLVASIGTSSSFCHPEFGQRLGRLAVGMFASDKPDQAHVRPDALGLEGRRTLAWASARYQRRYGTTMSAEALGGFSNGYSLLAHVLPAATSFDPAAVARSALATKLPRGMLANGGGLDLAPPGAPDEGENRRAAGVIWEWVAPGQRAVVWPTPFATHSIEPLRAG
jgi:branched-chain amino acid transport system substrate-binding protein